MKRFSWLTLAALVALAVAQVPPPPFEGAREECYNTETDGVQGWCEHTDCCAYDYYVSNLCGDYPGNVKCCYSHNSCAASWGCDDPSCGASEAELACDILRMYEEGKVTLQAYHDNFSGNLPSDGASALSNVRDACYRRPALRSSYGVSPGGCVCLKYEALLYLRDYAQKYWDENQKPIYVTAIAGGEHSATSWHYEGNTVDIACKDPSDHCLELEIFCRSRNTLEVCYPNSPCGSHETWVHCALPY